MWLRQQSKEVSNWDVFITKVQVGSEYKHLCRYFRRRQSLMNKVTCVCAWWIGVGGGEDCPTRNGEKGRTVLQQVVKDPHTYI